MLFSILDGTLHVALLIKLDETRGCGLWVVGCGKVVPKCLEITLARAILGGFFMGGSMIGEGVEFIEFGCHIHLFCMLSDCYSFISCLNYGFWLVSVV